MSTDPATPPRGLAALDVVVPGSPGWDDARRAWNLTVDQRPDAVFMPGDAEEVAAAVRAAGAAGLRVAVQATGHGAGPRRNLEGTLLINTSRMRGASVDPASRTARVEAGAQWRDVGPLAAEHGLAALHGSAPDVGVVGYTLGGGVGWLGRRYGLAANSVTAIEVVTADGEAVRADADTEPDLFWALRGGGSFGVVTALEFRLYPVESLNVGWLVWPWEEARRVLARWAEWTDTVPEEVTSIGRILQLPPLPDLPEAFRGRQMRTRPPASWRPCASSVRSSTRSPRARRRRCPSCTWTRPSRSRPPPPAPSSTRSPPRRSTPWWTSPAPGRAPRWSPSSSATSAARSSGRPPAQAPSAASTAASWSSRPAS